VNESLSPRSLSQQAIVTEKPCSSSLSVAARSTRSNLTDMEVRQIRLVAIAPSTNTKLMVAVLLFSTSEY
jgi:hypothetical protein